MQLKSVEGAMSTEEAQQKINFPAQGRKNKLSLPDFMLIAIEVVASAGLLILQYSLTTAG